MRIVLDTNVFLAAFGGRGFCHELFEIIITSHTVITSEPILDEFARNLSNKFRVPAKTVKAASSFLKTNSKLVEPSKVAKDIGADAADRLVLGTAVAGKADYLITGDQNLVDIGRCKNTKIITPRQFWEIIKGDRDG